MAKQIVRPVWKSGKVLLVTVPKNAGIVAGDMLILSKAVITPEVQVPTLEPLDNSSDKNEQNK